MNESTEVRNQTSRQLAANASGADKQQSSAATKNKSKEDAPKETNTLSVNQGERQIQVNQKSSEGGLEINENGNPPQKTDSADNTDVGNTNMPDNGKTAGIDKEALEDPDFGHYDDEKIKLQDGDIIDYLMKEWILEGAAWGINKACGLAGAILYEIGRKHHRKAKQHRRELWDATKKTASNIYHDHINPSHDNWRDCINDHNQAVSELSANLERVNKALDSVDENSRRHAEHLALISRQIGKRQILLQDGKFILVGSGQEIQDPLLNKTFYEQVQKKADEFMIETMRESLGINVNDKKEMKNLTKFYDELVKKHSGQEFDQTILSSPDCSKYTSAFHSAREKYTANMSNPMAVPARQKLHLQAQLFAEYYSQFRLNAKYLNNQNANMLTKKRKEKAFGKLRMKEYTEAYKMFMQLQQSRQNELRTTGHSDIPSNEVLLQIAKEQRDTSTNQVTKDHIKEIYKPRKDGDQLDMVECAKNSNKLIDNYNANLRSLDNEVEQRQISEEMRDTERARIQRMRESINNNRNPTPNSQRVPPETSRGGHQTGSTPNPNGQHKPTPTAGRGSRQ